MPYVKGILVYGSFTKGYADVTSDIDICAIEKEGVGFVRADSESFGR